MTVNLPQDKLAPRLYFESQITVKCYLQRGPNKATARVTQTPH
jgi:hypothetical protein